MDTLQKLKIIEDNHLAHFAFLPRKLGFKVTEIHGITTIYWKLPSGMFNIAYGAYGAPRAFKVSASVQEIKKVFGGHPFAWWIPPSQHHPELTKTLLDNHFIIEGMEQAMICDVSMVKIPPSKTDLQIKPVTKGLLLQDFINILKFYDSSIIHFYKLLNNDLLQLQEKFFVGYKKDIPVTIGILFVSDHSAGIFTLLTKEELRGQGYGTDLMVFLMNTAKQADCQFVTLCASSDSGYRIYERLGFRPVGTFECFEYKGG